MFRPVYSAEHLQPVDGGEVHLFLPASPLRVSQGAAAGICLISASFLILIEVELLKTGGGETVLIECSVVDLDPVNWADPTFLT